MLRKLTDCLRPDWICPSAAAVDFAGLAAAGKRLVLLDIDNTLAPHGARLPGPYARQIVDAIRQAGLIPFIISNAKPARAQTFAAALQAEAIGLAGKPSPRALIRACRQMQISPGQAVMIGDQLLTDVLAARRAGIFVILVEPVDRHEAWNVAAKRWLEAPFRRRFHREHRRRLNQG